MFQDPGRSAGVLFGVRTQAVITRLVRNCALGRMIQHSRDGCDIRISRGVLDAPPSRGMTSLGRGYTAQCCSRIPSITTVDAVLLPGKFESSQSRRSVPLSQTLRFIL